MVDRASIQDLLISYFVLDDPHTINDDLTVDTTGSVIVRERGNVFKNGRLPIKFGSVGYDFDVVNTGLTTLEGAPHTVGDTFMCSANKLTTLEHGPQKVSYGYVIGTNPLINLEGFPTSNAPEMVSMRYMPHLPLLKLLSCKHIRLYPPQDHDTPEEQRKVDQISEILNKYAGRGQAGIIHAARDLIQKEYTENARW
jgi:hypothetical protein